MTKKPRPADHEFKWATADHETRKRWVRILRNDQHSDETIGEFLGVTKGTIVGFRHRFLSELTFGKKAVPGAIQVDRFRDLLQIESLKERETEHPGTVALPVPSAPESADIGFEAPEPEPVPSAPEPIEPRPVPAPAPEPEPPKPPPPPEPVCEWPVPGRSLKKPDVCGDTPVPGERFCKKHLALVRKYV